MRSVFKCVKGFDGDNIILNARVEYKRFEDIKDFKKRVKKHKYYSEDYILEDLYTYMSYSDDLLNLIDKQQKEIEELKKPKYLAHFENNKTTKIELINDFISKDKIRKFIKDELPDDEIMECCGTYDVNGVRLREELEKLLEE